MERARLETNVVWWLATVVIALALAGVVAWYFRQVSRRRCPPGFFLIAVVIHVFLVVGSFYVYLDPGAVPQIQRQFHRMVVSGRTSLEACGGCSSLRLSPSSRLPI